MKVRVAYLHNPYPEVVERSEMNAAVARIFLVMMITLTVFGLAIGENQLVESRCGHRFL